MKIVIKYGMDYMDGDRRYEYGDYRYDGRQESLTKAFVELFNFECWALTCQSFYNLNKWVWMFDEFDYSDDY